jgi:hypothetical protein
MTMRLTLIFLACIGAIGEPFGAGELHWLDVTLYAGWNGPEAHNLGPTHETFRSVRSQQEWQALWATLSPTTVGPRGNAPNVDFEKYTMIVAALGERRSGGYTVQVQNALDDGTAVRVSVLEVRPGRDCTVTLEVTYPISIALVPRTDRPIHFQVGAADFDCSASTYRK